MLWRERRWVALIDYINGLPSASRLSAAVLNDPEMAAELAFQEPTGRWSPPVNEWDLDTVLLAEVLDRLGEVVAATASLGGAKPKRRKPFPRPETEVDRVRRRVQQDAVNDLISELTGGR